MRLRNYLIERNILNLDAIDDIIQTIFNIYSIENININANIKKWFKTTFRKWMINHYEDVIKVDNHIIKQKYFRGERSREQQWVKKAIDRGDDIYAFRRHYDTRLINQMRHVIDYFMAPENHNLRIQRMSMSDAIRNSDRWTEQLINKKVKNEDPDGIEVLKSYSGGWKWVDVISKQSLEREGIIMKHCVGGAGYADRVESGAIQIISLRDKNNKPHATVEYNTRSGLRQLKGPTNGPIKPELVKYVIDYFNNTSKIAMSSTIDLIQNGILLIGKQLIDINNELPSIIPNDLIFNTYMKTEEQLIKLPPKFNIKGDFIVTVGKIGIKFPTELMEADGRIQIYDMIIKNMPKVMKNKGIISFANVKMKCDFPKRIECKKFTITLNVNTGKRIWLPEYISGRLNLNTYGNYINLGFPKRMVIKEDFRFNSENIDKLHSGITVGGDLYLIDKYKDKKIDVKVKGKIKYV